MVTDGERIKIEVALPGDMWAMLDAILKHIPKSTGVEDYYGWRFPANGKSIVQVGHDASVEWPELMIYGLAKCDILSRMDGTEAMEIRLDNLRLLAASDQIYQIEPIATLVNVKSKSAFRDYYDPNYSLDRIKTGVISILRCLENETPKDKEGWFMPRGNLIGGKLKVFLSKKLSLTEVFVERALKYLCAVGILELSEGMRPHKRFTPSRVNSGCRTAFDRPRPYSELTILQIAKDLDLVKLDEQIGDLVTQIRDMVNLIPKLEAEAVRKGEYMKRIYDGIVAKVEAGFSSPSEE